MKKFTSLMMVLLCAITTSWAAATDLPTLTTDAENPVWYLIKNVRKSKYATYAGDNATMTQQETATASSFFYFTGSITDGVATVKIHNYVAGDKLCAAYNSWTTEGIDWYIKAQATGISICTSTGEWDAWNDAGGGGQKVEYWNASDAGSAWEVELVTDFSSVIDISAAKAAAVTELENLAKISVLFPDATQAIADVNAVEATGTSLNELNAAIDAINAIVAEYKKSIDGKNIKLTNCSTGDARGGRYLGYDNANSRAAAVASNGDDVIWTIKYSQNGTFKLYNWVNDLYLADPESAATTTNENDAPTFTFIATAENQLAVVCSNNKMVHIANHTNYKVMSYYSLTDKASLWNITAVDPIVVTHDQYNAAAAAATTLPYAIQQAYGLVTDASNYYSNYKSDAEGSYEALLDNASDSYFHSAYGNEAGDGSGVHYIQANLGEGNSVDEFYVYMAPRTQNGNNRPVNVTVSGSNDNSVYTEITTITTTLNGTTTPYLSAKLGTDGTNYQYIRLTVTSTNSGTTFFTLSELYFFPATSDVTTLVEAYSNFATLSITNVAKGEAATALINAETTLALSNIKKEIAALIAANAGNHEETPALGKYTTAAYNALVAANEAADATQESLEAALATFNASKNVPVYFITSAAPATSTASYATGKAILYNGSAWRFETTNKYNKQTWMTIPSYTEENIPTVTAYDAAGTKYEICDYLTGTVMRNKSVQIVAIEGWDGVYNLQYGTATNDAVQHAQNGGALVGWNPATTTDCLASAWRVEYIGNTYDLDKLTDAQLTALTALQTAYNANIAYKTAEFSNALGEYSYTGNISIADAFAQAEAILNASFVVLSAMEVSAIEAATSNLTAISTSISINMPAAGTYIRIKSVAEWGAEKTYLSSANATESSRAAFVADADAHTIFYFDGTQLVSYASGNYLVNNNNFLGYNGVQTAGTSIAFEAASDNLTGAYNIIFKGNNDGNRKLYTNKSGYTDAAGETASGLGYDFNLEEVTELPVTITSAGYATFYAPVDVEYTGIEAYYTIGEIAEEKYLQLVDFEGTIPAKDGAILKGNEGTYNLTISSGAEKKAENKLTGTAATTVISKVDVNSYYVLGRDTNGNVGLYNPINGENTDVFTNTGHKAYMLIEGAAQTIGYSLGFDWGGTTGIENIEDAVEENATEAIYDITGRQIKAITVPGIYIINGKKTFVK